MRVVILGNTPVLDVREMCCSGRLANKKNQRESMLSLSVLGLPVGFA